MRRGAVLQVRPKAQHGGRQISHRSRRRRRDRTRRGGVSGNHRRSRGATEARGSKRPSDRGAVRHVGQRGAPHDCESWG